MSTTENPTSTSTSTSSHVRQTPGTPCWFQIPALDVHRAKEFYASVFKWDFTSTPHYPEEEMAIYSFPDPNVKLAGGIVKLEKMATLDPPVGKDYEGENKVTMFFWSDDIEKTLEKIVEAGGRVVRGKENEGDHGFRATFADTEGNVQGLYMLAATCKGTDS